MRHDANHSPLFLRGPRRDAHRVRQEGRGRTRAGHASPGRRRRERHHSRHRDRGRGPLSEGPGDHHAEDQRAGPPLPRQPRRSRQAGTAARRARESRPGRGGHREPGSAGAGRVERAHDDGVGAGAGDEGANRRRRRRGRRRMPRRSCSTAASSCSRKGRLQESSSTKRRSRWRRRAPSSKPRSSTWPRCRRSAARKWCSVRGGAGRSRARASRDRAGAGRLFRDPQPDHRRRHRSAALCRRDGERRACRC